MVKEDKNIEKMFRKEFDGFTADPTPELWSAISRRVRWNNFMRFQWNRFNIFYAGIIVAVIGTAIFAFMMQDISRPGSQDPVKKIPPTQNQAMNQPGDQLSDETKSIVENTGRNKGEKSSVNLNKQEKKQKKSNLIIKQDNRKENVSTPKEINNVNKKITTPDLPAQNNNSTLMAYFIPSSYSGCVPLQVNFKNLSNDASSYSWSFGDGGESSKIEPTYIFDEPGEYIVNLTALNDKNEVSTFSQSIMVNSLPEVNFSMDIQDIGEGGIPVYFYNKSKGAIEFTWEFGDGGISVDKEPSWIYDSQGNYNVKLTGISEEGCIDSMILKNAFEEGVPEILLPNAFSPNTFGPSGGYYSAKDNTNDVFHPWFEENPVEYQLRIFNRKGNLVFESTEINIGWDGYYLQGLQPQGVYIYKLRAKFENGKTLVKMGDVTLFHEK